MGRVWLARDSVLGRQVAIKVLRDDLALPPRVLDELVARMRHEAQAAALVSHPNIVTLYDMGEDDAVGLYLVFEYVSAAGLSSARIGHDDRDRGHRPESLRDRLRAGPLPLGEVTKLAREVGSALAFAHAKGVIHRDIKPENILFSATGAKVADFGIARIPESTITRANAVLGTPAYTSPEVLSDATFGPASDQFAFAATLYEAAAGVRAFGSDDPTVTAGKVSTEPPPPLDPGLGPVLVIRALNAALGRGLAKAPEARFASCIDLGDAVARAIERPNDGPLIDAMLVAASAPHLDDNGAASERIEVERSPLGSRLALERAARRSSYPSSATPYFETPIRPSIIVRKETKRWQNILAATALLVIVTLVAIGKKTRERVADQDALLPVASLAPSASSAPPASHVAAKRQVPRAAQSALPAPVVAPPETTDAAPASASPNDR